MPQSSYIYAAARVRVLENSLIGQDRIRRMVEGSLEDAVRLLVEAGYGDMPDATVDDCETMIARELERTQKLVCEISPKPEVTDLFLMKADIHNLKVLLKARLLKTTDDPFLLSGGLIAKDTLALAVRDHDYRDLPPAIKDALNALEKTLSSKEDPQQVSIVLDRAYQEHARSVLEKHKNAFAQSYFLATADFDNVLTLLRLRAMGGSKEALEAMLLPAGAVAHSTLIAAFDQPMEMLPKLLATGAAGQAMEKGFEEVQRTGNISAMEKARDNYLMQLIKKDKYDVMTLQPVIGYLLAREQEARCIRLIVTAKRNGLSEHVITERLREVYG